MISDLIKKNIFYISQILKSKKMFLYVLLSVMLCMIFLFTLPYQVVAEITTDGTFGVATTLSGPDFSITADLGQQRDGNLFHSFSQFNIAQSESATFSGPAAIANIINRIAGGSISTIDGLLRSDIDGANVFLSNPAGVMFGANSTLDISGSFHISTADYIVFDDLTQFMSTPQAGEVLSSAAPAAFGFLGTPVGSIQLQASQLTTTSGSTQSFIGAGIDIDNVNLQSESGTISIVAVASAGEVSINTSTPSGITNFGDLSIISSSLLDVSGGAGNIILRCKDLLLDDASLYSQVTSDLSSGMIDIGASGDMYLGGGSTIDTSSYTSANAGMIYIDLLGGLELEDGSVLKASTLSPLLYPGDAGDITIQLAGDLVINGSSRIEAVSYGDGRAGSINVAADYVRINSGFISVFGDGSGDSGSIDVSAQNIDLIGADLLSAEATGTGREGSIILSAANQVTFNLDTGESWDFKGSIDSGFVTKQGAGILTLSGDSTVSNTTSVLNGTLEVNGNVDSSILVGGTAKLSGTGLVADTRVDGVLAPGSSIATLSLGDITFTGGSQYIIEADNAGNSDSIIVSGTVDLGSAALDIHFQSGSYLPRTEYLIIDNDGNDQVVGAFASVTATSQPASSLVTVDNSGGDGNDVVVMLSLIEEVTLPGLNSDTVTFRVTGEEMSAQSVATITTDIPSTIISTPYGKVSYTVSAPSGGMVTMRLTFSTPLPDAFKVFSIDSSNNFKIIPQLSGNQGYWQRIDSTTVDVTLRDNGLYDLDAALGSVDAQIVLATVRPYLLYHILPAIHEIAKQQTID